MFGNLGRYNVTRHNWLRSKILQITFFRDVRFRVITVIVIRLVEAFSFLIFWQRNHLAAAPGDSSGGNNDLCGSEKKKVKVELFGWSLSLWHLLAWAVQWCPCRFSGSSLEVEQIPNNWSLKSWDFSCYKVYLFIYQVELCDEVVEVLVAGVHMRFGAWKAY